MVSRKRARVDAIVHGPRPFCLLQKTFHLLRHGREAAIESNHELAVALRVCTLNLNEFIFIQAQRLLAKHVLAGLQRTHNLCSMQVMPGRNHDRVDRRIGINPVIAGGAVGKLKSIADEASARSVRRGEADQFRSAILFNCRQQSALSEVSSSDESNTNRARRGRGNSARNQFQPVRNFRLVRGIPDQHTEIRRLCGSGDQFISSEGILNREAMCDQRLQIQTAVAEQLQKRFHIAGLSPAHVADRIISALLLERGVVTAGSIRSRNPEVDFFFVIQLAL